MARRKGDFELDAASIRWPSPSAWIACKAGAQGKLQPKAEWLGFVGVGMDASLGWHDGGRDRGSDHPPCGRPARWPVLQKSVDRVIAGPEPGAASPARRNRQSAWRRQSAKPAGSRNATYGPASRRAAPGWAAPQAEAPISTLPTGRLTRADPSAKASRRLSRPTTQARKLRLSPC